MPDSMPPFAHVIVLMFENRSFDHLFGAFPGANGLLDENGNLRPDIYNLDDPTQPPPSDPSHTHYPHPITPDDELVHDCFHDFTGMMPELFGPGCAGWVAGAPISAPSPTWPASNAGFYSAAAYNVDPSGKTPNGPPSLAYYQHGSLQVLHSLAAQFVLCDNWFCDVPGDTLLNRFFMHAATADGELDDSEGSVIDVPTIYDRITAQGATWKMYVPFAEVGGKIVGNGQIDSRFFPSTQDSPCTNRPVTELAADLAAGTLPSYSFVMCWLPKAAGGWPQDAETSMHPVSDIRSGENYLAAVYNALRGSAACWENTLLVVTFDENGGLYDHVPPPAAPAPVPGTAPATFWDPNRNIETSFDYSLLGPRIPALLISPWLSPGVADGQYQNSSILRLVHDLFGTAPLNARDAAAPSLDGAFAQFGLEAPRQDCPQTVPTYQGFPYAAGDLSQTYVPPAGAEAAVAAQPPHIRQPMAEMARIYDQAGPAPG